MKLINYKNKCACWLVVLITLFATSYAAPATSQKVKERFDEKITSFITDRGFPGAVITIYKNGNQIMNEGFGICSDVDKPYPIASLSKLFTEVAINKLISEKVLSPNTRVYDYLGLKYQPMDARVKSITIKQLLEHKGGWDRDIASDPMFRLQDYFPNKDVRSIDKKEFQKFVLTQFPLNHEPGTTPSYSNFGYFLLGAVVEKATHENYLQYINEAVASPIHVNFFQATTPHTYSREIPYPDCFSLELSSSSFGLAAKMSDVAYFFSNYDRNGSLSSPHKNKMSWWKDGSLPGTATLMLRERINNVVIVVYIPDRDENNWEEDNATLKTLIDNTANSVGL